MPSLKNIPWPKFSLTGLFWFASAVAIGFAVSQKTFDDSPDPWISIAEEAFYSSRLLNIAAVLFIYELVRQAVLIRKETRDYQQPPFPLQLAWVTRALLALTIFGLLMLTQLINRQILVLNEPEEFIQFYGELWPGVVLVLMLLVAMRLMIARRVLPQESNLKRWGSRLVITLGLGVIGLYIITDRLLVTWLVHIAVDSVEKSHAIQWQRPDVFPHHASEGFRSFWEALSALLIVLMGGFAILLTTKVRLRGLAVILWGISLLCCVIGLRYAWWFVTQAFPRINPDLAGEFRLLPLPDYIAGAVLLLSLAAVFGYQLAKLRISNDESTKAATRALPRLSGLMAIAASLVALGCGSDLLVYFYESINTTPWWAMSDIAWLNRVAKLVGSLLFPESLISLLVALSGITLVWQYYRPVTEPAPPACISALQFATYTVAATAFITAATPVLAIFGFCYWLGPWVL